MRRRQRFSAGVIISLLLITEVTLAAKEQKTRNVVVTADEEKVRDRAGFEAIAEIHREMDDDNSGSIDRTESTGFMKEDMNMRTSDRQRREKAFHHDDDAISVDDLWEAWFESEERAWNTEQAITWLVTVVNLPQYSDQFRRHKIDGRHLPRIAVHNSSFITNVLGVKSSVHRQKLRLNALDVVLFGLRVDSSGRVKDVALGLLVILLSSLLYLYVRQKRRAEAESAELSSQLSQLKAMESEFEESQRLFAERRKRHESEGNSREEMLIMKQQLEEAERRLEQNGGAYAAPLALQPLLRKACEAELNQMEKLRSECVGEMREAIELVDKLKKKQSSVINSIKLATGASSGSDQLDARIFGLKARMDKIHAQMAEVQERWLQIESLCGFPILYTTEAVLPQARSVSQANNFYRTPSAPGSTAGAPGPARQPSAGGSSSSSSDGWSSTTGSQRSLTALNNNVKKESASIIGTAHSAARNGGGQSITITKISPRTARRAEGHEANGVSTVPKDTVAPSGGQTNSGSSSSSSSTSSAQSSPRIANGNLPSSTLNSMEEDSAKRLHKKSSGLSQLFKKTK